MVTVLIVDDERYVIDDLLNIIDWDALGIDHVLTARGVQSAIQQIRSQSIDLLLTDIEMPQGDGLELLRWVRQHDSRIECAFLTCHADFLYAQEALRLGCFDYLLKPIMPDSLSETLKKMLSRLVEKDRINALDSFDKLRDKDRPMREEHFWRGIIRRLPPLSAEQARQIANQCAVDCADGSEYYLVLFDLHPSLSCSNDHMHTLTEYALFLDDDNDLGACTFLYQPDLPISIIKARELPVERLQSFCIKLAVRLRTEFACGLSCFISKPAPAYLMPERVRALTSMRKRCVLFGLPVLLEGNDMSTDPSETPEDRLLQWRFLCQNRRFDELTDNVCEYLRQLCAAPCLNRETLSRLQQDLLQIFYAFLDAKGIHAHKLFAENPDNLPSDTTLRSLETLTEWIMRVTRTTTECLRVLENTSDIVVAVKEYIHANLNTELSREKIAGVVYLNPDYLDRIFKERTSVTVMRYLSRERIQLAKRLLAGTSAPIGRIAESCGYNSISNFSAVFRKSTGMTPGDWRRHKQNNPNDD